MRNRWEEISRGSPQDILGRGKSFGSTKNQLELTRNYGRFAENNVTHVSTFKDVYLTILHLSRVIRVWSSRWGVPGRQLGPDWAAKAARVQTPWLGRRLPWPGGSTMSLRVLWWWWNQLDPPSWG